ncbi:DUF378 domain-containing protein [Hyalangium versicolor]|uniref:DUF378 domain-containing protein n=1 Tax=Hyalangium versicolor TaxID=2861190 RepID=UPI002107936C|nr:DUF378 domain-containing protein [Hyalangium versicolor]
MERINTDRMSGFIKFLAVVAIIGAVNWGLIGFFNWNLVDAIFGGGAREQTSALARLIYALVGLAGVALALVFPWQRKVLVGGPTGIGIERRVDVRP